MDETLTDNALAKTARHDAEAFALLYRRHLQCVYSYLLSRVTDVQDAQDLTTQTFIAALQGISAYEARGAFVAWLLGIARRKAADHFRDRKPVLAIEDIAPLADGEPALDQLVIEHLRIEQVTALLARLNPERAEALRLRYFAGLKIREVAEVMARSEGAVKMLIARGLEDMQQMVNIQEEMS